MSTHQRRAGDQHSAGKFVSEEELIGGAKWRIRQSSVLENEALIESRNEVFEGDIGIGHSGNG